MFRLMVSCMNVRMRLMKFCLRLFVWFLDMILKTLIVTYQQCILLPLKVVFQGKNILLMYFTPDAGLASKASSYLTGIRLIQPGAFYYGGAYIVFLLVFFYVCAHPEIKKQSNRA